MFALDTNTVAYFFRGEGRVAKRLLETPPREIAVPAVVVYEIEAGLLRITGASRREAQLQALLDVVEVLPFGRPEARAAATIRADLERRGLSIGPHDMLIAGTAKERGAVLVTHNVREFRRVRDLRIEDWY